MRGEMSELLTAAQMRAVETAAISSGAVSGLALMEQAGRGVVEAVFENWPEMARVPGRACVLCGPGNNGGDGFVVARLLHDRGWGVEVFLYGDPEKLPPDARANYGRWRALGSVRRWAAQDVAGCDADLIVEAVFGAGLTRAPAAEILEPIARMSGCGDAPARLVAVDAPAGLCMDSGRPLAEATVRAALTVTFHRARPGHYLAEGPEHCGTLRIKDIGLPAAGEGGAQLRLAAPDPATLVKHRSGHKYGHGHALILSGGAGRTGAARLAARGALRVGAGLVTLGVPPAAQQEVACQITALMLRRVADGAALAEVLADHRINALCLGPGLGLDRARDLVPVALGAGRATVLDADAITGFAEDSAVLFGMLHESCVLTPHGGEFARLFPDIAERLSARPERGPAYSKVDATRAAAERAGCVVLFKGPDTVIAAPDGRCSLCAAAYGRAAPWLATAGAGDVLAGLICGLLARGFDPFEAAGTAAWLHQESARRFGPGLIAEDLPEALPGVLRALQG